MNRTSRTPTIYDIAASTKSSAATVSLVLNGSWARYRIKPDTAQRILLTAAQLGYNVNLKARGLRLSRSGLAGMILPHYRNRFFADLAEAFEAQARQRGLCPVVVSTQRDPEVEAQFTRTLLAQRVEFLFIAGVPQPGLLNQLCTGAAVPCVNLDLPGPGAPSVVSDNRGGARRLTHILIEKVRARGGALGDMLYLGGVRGEYATDNRFAGFVEAIQSEQVVVGPDMFACCGYPPSSARQALERFVAIRGRLPAALFVNSIAAFEGLVQFATSLPQQALGSLIVGCFDWDPFAAQLPFDVTMLQQDVDTMMRRAFEALAGEVSAIAPFIMVPPLLRRSAAPQDGGSARL